MSTAQYNKYASGLVFLGMRELDIVGLSSLVTQVFEANNRRVCQVRILSDERAVVHGDDQIVRLMTKIEYPPASHADRARRLDGEAALESGESPMVEGTEVCIYISIETIDPNADMEQGLLMAFLASVTEFLSRETGADMVQWLDPDVVLSAQDFGTAMSPKASVKTAVNAPIDALVDTPVDAIIDAPVRAKARRIVLRDAQKLDARPEMCYAPIAPIDAVEIPSGTHADGEIDAEGNRRFPDVETITDALRSSLSAFESGAERGSDAFQAHFDATEKTLRDVFRIDPDDATKPAPKIDTAAIRLATWAIAITVALFALPLAIFLIILNLVRGENLRLAGQALALTGLMIPLNASGAFADILMTFAG